MSRHLTRLLEIAAVFGAALIIIVVGLPFAGDNFMAKQLVIWVANVAMILIVALGLKRRGEGWSHFGVRRIENGLRLIGASLLAFVFAIAAFVIGSIIMANITGIPESADMSSYEFLSGNLPMLFVALSGIFIASSFGEEFVYRGFLTTRIAEMMGGHKRAWIWAVVISSLAFGLAHYSWGPMGIVQTTFMGAALAIAWIKAKRNLWVVIIVHAYMDVILMVQMYLA